MRRRAGSPIPLIAALAASIAAGCGTPSGRKAQSGDETGFWLDNMVVYHGYSNEEVAAALGVSPEEAGRLLAERGIRPGPPPARGPADPIRVLPYPGGRHPRIGFLDGAVDPHRDTKASVFLPWEGGGYVVLDLPEALWADGELAYLAHTDIPTVWDKKGVKLDPIDWTREGGGILSARRVLPDGLEFAARIVPGRDAVDMELSLRNGTSRKIAGLRAQVCVLLKGAPEFNDQTNDNKVARGEAMAVRARDGRRWIAVSWDRGRAWANPPCPCLHSDPTFPELAPGEEASARGRLVFHPDGDLEAALERLRKP